MSMRVVARLPAKKDKVDEVKTILRGLIGPTRKEKGCITYELLQNKVDPADFTLGLRRRDRIMETCLPPTQTYSTSATRLSWWLPAGR